MADRPLTTSPTERAGAGSNLGASSLGAANHADGHLDADPKAERALSVPPSANRLATILGLSPQETTALGRMFVTAAGALGLDGAFIFERLSRGDSLASALALPAGTSELLYSRAHRWFSAGRPERAEPLFQALCLISGSDADYWVGYGVCLKLRGASAEAMMAFEVAGRLRPNWAMPDFHALEVALQNEDYERAQDCLERFHRNAGAGDIPEAVISEAARWSAALELRAARANGREDEMAPAPDPSSGNAASGNAARGNAAGGNAARRHGPDAGDGRLENGF